MLYSFPDGRDRLLDFFFLSYKRITIYVNLRNLLRSLISRCISCGRYSIGRSRSSRNSRIYLVSLVPLSHRTIPSHMSGLSTVIAIGWIIVTSEALTSVVIVIIITLSSIIIIIIIWSVIKSIGRSFSFLNNLLQCFGNRCEGFL